MGKITNISVRIKRLLKDRGWSQARLAELAGLQSSHLSRLLTGKRPWALEHIEGIARALEMQSSELVADTDATGLLSPNGARVDREYMETLTSELSRVTVRLQEVQAEADALRRSNSELERRVMQSTIDIERLQRDNDLAKKMSSITQGIIQGLSKKVTELGCGVASRDRQIEELKAKCDAIVKNLQAANQQITINYDAWAQAEARAQELQKRLGEEGGSTQAAALFGGLLGLGLGVAAAASSGSNTKRLR